MGTTTRALSECYRRASNIHEGYEIHTHDAGWLTVTGVLRIYAPANIVMFTFADGERFTTTPNDEVMSRRPAGAS